MKIRALTAIMLLVASIISSQENVAVNAPSLHSNKVAEAALSILDPKVEYDPTYFKIDYPNGDIPLEKGVCTDVVIRTYRKLDVDLQVFVHLDMANNFEVYPKNWGLVKTDKNIDHRRVSNLMKFFSRQGTIKKISNDPKDFHEGDIVAWDLGSGITHIGIVSNVRSKSERLKIVHNIGNGQVLEDVLFNWKVIGHYSY